MNAWITSVLLVLSAGDANPGSIAACNERIERRRCKQPAPCEAERPRRRHELSYGRDQSAVCRACFRD